MNAAASFSRELKNGCFGRLEHKLLQPPAEKMAAFFSFSLLKVGSKGKHAVKVFFHQLAGKLAAARQPL